MENGGVFGMRLVCCQDRQRRGLSSSYALAVVDGTHRAGEEGRRWWEGTRQAFEEEGVRDPSSLLLSRTPGV